MKTLVLAVGELLIDFVPGEKDTSLYDASTLRKAAGGAPANVAAVVARLGGDSAFVGRVGNDSFGRWLRDTLGEVGIDTSGTVLDGGAQTTLAFVSVDAVGDRDFSFYRNDTADTRLAARDLREEQLAAAAVLHYCSNSLTHESSRHATLEAARRASAHGALVSFDVNYRAPLWSSASEARSRITEALAPANIIKLSEAELEFLAGSADPEAAHDLLKPGVRLLLLSAGAEGVHVLQRGRHGHVRAWPVEAADTTGAGDALAGAVLHQIARDRSLLDSFDRLLEAVSTAAAVAALSTRTAGAIPSYPDQASVEAFMAGRRAG